MDRRCLLAALGAGALVACSSGDDSTNVDAGDDATTDDAGDGGGDETTGCAMNPPGKNVGAVTSFPVGTWKLVTMGANVIVAQDTNGLFAFSAICTHQGCLVGAPAKNGATTCPCHFSTFDGNGKVTGGPAPSPLPHFAVAVCGGSVFVDTSTKVSTSTRTPPA